MIFRLLQVLLLILLLDGQVLAYSCRDSLPAFLLRLDTITKGQTTGRYFASFYFKVSEEMLHQLPSESIDDQRMMQRFMRHFANYFFQAEMAASMGGPVPATWQQALSTSGCSNLQYLLAGINAHVNKDLWQALTSCFTLEELRRFKKCYGNYYQVLKRQYDGLYDRYTRENKWLHAADRITLGLTRLYGKSMLKRWRKRQFRLAILFFKNLPLFARKRQKLDRKVLRTDQLIWNNIH